MTGVGPPLGAHGYTNETSAEGESHVRKTYSGSDASTRAAVEVACLQGLRQMLPVPAVISSDASSVLMELVPGRHGQDSIEAGYGREVMRAAGALLRTLQSVDTGTVAELPGDGAVITHGDFGPQNLLFDEQHRIAAVLDWEFAHRGSPVEDLAWSEWIVRMHHPADLDAVGELFAGYGTRPGWPVRHAAMLARCRELLDRCARERQHEAVAMWADRLAATTGWVETPR